jgi:mevalonate pyrophosphate decarboxylase
MPNGSQKATAQALPNIALIKYWGNRDHALRIPANSSLSMNLAGLTTTISFDDSLEEDVAVLSSVERPRSGSINRSWRGRFGGSCDLAVAPGAGAEKNQ